MSQNIYHMLPEARWASDWPNGQYRPETFEADGFVHCSPAPSMALVDIGNMFYRESDGDWIVLEVDPSKLKSLVKWEQPMAVGDTESTLDKAVKMPHVYGPLDREACTVKYRMLRKPKAEGARFYGISDEVG